MSSAEIIKNGTLQTFQTKLYKVNAFLHADCMCTVQGSKGFLRQAQQQPVVLCCRCRSDCRTRTECWTPGW